MQPINYMQGYQNPLDVIMGHVDKFQQFTQNRHVLQQQAEANRMKQAENYRTLEAQDALRNLDFNNIESVRQFLARYPEHGEGAKAYLARHDEQEQKAMIADMSTSLNLLKNGRYDLLEQDWQEKANAYANMGNRAKELEYKRMIFQLKKDPKSLQGAMMMTYSAIVGDKAIEGFDKLQTAMSPKIRTIDAGDRHVVEHVDQMTGDVSYRDAFTKGQTPDNRADNRRAVEVANINANSAQNVAQINAQNDVDVANINQSGQNYRENLQQKYKYQIHREEIDKQGRKFQVIEAQGRMLKLFPDGSVSEIMHNGQPVMAKNPNQGKHLPQVMELKDLNDSSISTIQMLQKALQYSKQGIYTGAFADERANLMGKIHLDTDESRRTQMFLNIVQNTALQSMKAIFGGNPTEGERKILLDLQASASKPPEVRHQILMDAMKLIKDRVKSRNEQIKGYGYGQYVTTSPSSKPQTGQSKTNPFQ